MAIPYGGLLATHFLRRAGVRREHRIAVYGASGSIGTSAVQLAREIGATVTGVCSGANFDLVRSLGAESCVDYTVEDFTASGVLYDVVLDAVGRRKSAAALRSVGRALAPTGVLRPSAWPLIPQMTAGANDAFSQALAASFFVTLIAGSVAFLLSLALRDGQLQAEPQATEATAPAA